jgi:hypothetical protein
VRSGRSAIFQHALQGLHQLCDRGPVDRGLDEFVDRLLKTIGGLAGLSPTEVGFRDREGIELGAEWLPMLAAALANCNVMVALVSPNFLKSDWCA